MMEKYKVLIVDDDGILCSIFKDGLTDSGYDCQTATDGASALEQVGSNEFDVMVTDIIMPGMDGIELTEKVKKLSPEISVIVMTGFQQEESYDRAVAVGASDFIKKPFAMNELVIRIERVMRDSKIITEILRKQKEVRAISREMIAGMQDEAAKKIAKLETEIVELRKQMT